MLQSVHIASTFSAGPLGNSIVSAGPLGNSICLIKDVCICICNAPSSLKCSLSTVQVNKADHIETSEGLGAEATRLYVADLVTRLVQDKSFQLRPEQVGFCQLLFIGHNLLLACSREACTAVQPCLVLSVLSWWQTCRNSSLHP